MTCEIAEYVAEPYVFALKHGARFKWEKDPQKVTAYCPYGVEITATASGISYSCDRKCSLSTVDPCSSLDAIVDVVGVTSSRDLNRGLPASISWRVVPASTTTATAPKGNGLTWSPRALVPVSPTVPLARIIFRANEYIYSKLAFISPLRGVGFLVNHLIKGRCRYNKKLRRLARVCPDGLCPHAYNSAYKLALTLLYDGVVKNPIVKCPKGRVGMVVCAKDEVLKPLLNLAESVFQAAGCPKDIIDKRVYIKVISSHGCPKNVEEGRVFEFNTRDREMMCPTALHSMLGVIGQVNIFVCPANTVKYHIPPKSYQF